MTAMTVAWWELVVRAVVVFAVLLILVRISGKRVVGQFTPLDLVVLLIVSEAVSNALTGGDESLVGGLILAAVLMGLNYGASVLASRSERMYALLEGKPTVIGRDGEVDRPAMKQEKVAMGDVQKRLREEGLELGQVDKIILETDGKISFEVKQDR